MAGIRLSSLHVLPVALCLAFPALAADGGPSFEFKLRGGLTAGTLRRDQGANQTYGFGFAARRPWAEGTLALELSYDVMAGQYFDRMPVGGAVYGPALAGTSDPATGHPYYLTQSNSIDWRKEQASGWSLKAGYAAPLGWWDGLSWQGGVSLDAYQTSSEFTATLRPMYLGGTDGLTPTQAVDAQGAKYYEGIAQVRKGTTLAPGAFLGLRQQVGEDFALELNLRNFGARHYDWRPGTTTGRPAAMDESTHRGFLVEFCLAMSL
jgi:hypothetical protein